MLRRLSQGALSNVRFEDLVDVAAGFGFELSRVKGSHHIFTHPAIPGLLTLQEVGGQAKPYQIRQLLRLIERYNVQLGEDS
jgi:predicted RNA binding protein YcfA (HicA-like mRNA interferase family)